MPKKDKVWAILVHMGPWGGCGYGEMLDKKEWDDEMWDYIVEEAPKAGVNTIVLDICAGIEFASHPEITLDGAWTRSRLRKELARCREKGLALIPKINFATIHDVWLGPYHRMVSTPVSSRQEYVVYYNEGQYKDMGIEYVEQDPFLVNFRKVALPLMEEGYKCVPCASICNRCDYNTVDLMEYFRDNAPPDDQVVGYITTTWCHTLNKHKELFESALKFFKEAKEKIYG